MRTLSPAHARAAGLCRVYRDGRYLALWHGRIVWARDASAASLIDRASADALAARVGGAAEAADAGPLKAAML